MSWRENAACRDMDTSIFFPEQGHRWTADIARQTCDSCPVRAACLDEAVTRGERGIWGGTNDGERRELRQQGAVA